MISNVVLDPLIDSQTNELFSESFKTQQIISLLAMESCSVSLSQTVVAIQAVACKYCESMSELAALFRSGLDITLIVLNVFCNSHHWMS